MRLQAGQDSLLGKISVDRFVELPDRTHHDAVEVVEHLDTIHLFEVELEQRMLQGARQSHRTQRNLIGLERGATGDKPHAVTQQVECTGVADFRAVADFLNGQGYLEIARVHQFELGRVALPAATAAGRACLARRLIKRGQARFKVHEKARRNVRLAALDLADGLEQASLLFVAACVVGLLEQALFDFGTQGAEGRLEIDGSLQQAVQQESHPSRQ